MPNRLTNETSPYLLQHANNPVDWYPWGPEAFENAKAADKPILLSVGYSACHWCHVMERESFENGPIAEMMNASFICIKVDREERPDVDSIYMNAVQAMTGRGGWPMTVFLTPEGKPFYGGTYFPPEDRGGMPGFKRLIEAISGAYTRDRGNVERTTDQLVQRMQQMSSSMPSVRHLTTEVLDHGYRGLVSQFDDRHGGTGTEPKFPQPMVYEFLLRYYLRSSEPQALDMVELTLDSMAQGGIYDQIGGGFHRYSTDAEWLVPHFEKMLYDNALLVKLYVHAYQVTRKPLYRRVVEQTLDYVLREMTAGQGGFYSAQDADSEGVEGKFFVWQPEQVTALLGPERGDLINRYFGVSQRGNFEGANILHVARDPSDLAEDAGMTAEELQALVQSAASTLYDAREDRIHPERDDKVLTAWNGMMLRAFAEAGAVLGRRDYVAAAERNADFLLNSLRQDGRLLRTFKSGKAKLNGYLEDYAFLIDGLIVLHEATFHERWLREAIGLGDAMLDLFWDKATGQFYDTGRDHEALIVRPRDISDNAMPSGSSKATEVLLRLAEITGDAELRSRAVTALKAAGELMSRVPVGAGQWLCALDFSLAPTKEIAIVGDPAEEGTRALVAEVYRNYLPNRVFLGLSRASGSPGSDVPLLEAKVKVRGQPTAYVCQNYVCQLPVSTPEALAEQLAD